VAASWRARQEREDTKVAARRQSRELKFLAVSVSYQLSAISCQLVALRSQLPFHTWNLKKAPRGALLTRICTVSAKLHDDSQRLRLIAES